MFKGEENWSRDVYPCTYCSSGFISQELLDKHLYLCKSKKLQEASTFNTCDICNHQFSSIQNLKLHTNLCHGVFHCPECEEVFSSYEKRKTHHSKVHLGITLSCEECGKSFNNKGLLTRHVRTVHQEHQDYKCKQCGKEFNLLANLTRHVSTVHELSKPYKCTVIDCGIRLSQLTGLKTHMQSIHDKIKYPCTECEYQATQKSHLTRHKNNVHLGKYSFNCEFCKKPFKERQTLDFHTKSMHPTEYFRIYPEECNTCKKRFRDKTELALHNKHTHNHLMEM